jgi:hypothetical protein
MKIFHLLFLTGSTVAVWALHIWILFSTFGVNGNFLVGYYLGFYVYALFEAFLMKWISVRDFQKVGAVFLLSSTFRMLGLLVVFLALKVKFTLNAFAAINAVAVYFLYLLLSVVMVLPLLREKR